MRALRLKTGREHAATAERLFRDLLETAVIAEALKSNKKDSKMCHLKYSCLKNVGLMCAERGDAEAAFQHLVLAYDLDDTDVATMNRLGRLALDTERPLFALQVYQRCLAQNANYWPAADGILRVLCEREDYAEAYGWALQWYERNADYQLGLDVILEVRERFDGVGLEYIERMWKSRFADTHLRRTNPNSCFPSYERTEGTPLCRPELAGFGLAAGVPATWANVGELAVRMYERFAGAEALAWEYTVEEFLGRQGSKNGLEEERTTGGSGAIGTTAAASLSADGEALANVPRKYSTESSLEEAGADDATSKDSTASNGNTDATAATAAAAAAAGSDEPAGAEGADAAAIVAKPKTSRRRGGGDLVALEQWGWHKNKRYSQRKKSLDRVEQDTTVRGLLRKVLPRFYE